MRGFCSNLGVWVVLIRVYRGFVTGEDPEYIMFRIIAVWSSDAAVVDSLLCCNTTLDLHGPALVLTPNTVTDGSQGSKAKLETPSAVFILVLTEKNKDKILLPKSPSPGTRSRQPWPPSSSISPAQRALLQAAFFPSLSRYLSGAAG